MIALSVSPCDLCIVTAQAGFIGNCRLEHELPEDEPTQWCDGYCTVRDGGTRVMVE